MIRIESNIDETIAWFEKLEAEASQIPSLILAPERYRPLLTQTATAVLLGIAENDSERELVPQIVATITALMVTKSTLEYTMSAGFSGDATSSDEPAEISYDDVLKWVEEKKRKTSRDTYAGGRGRTAGEMQSNEVIAKRVFNIYRENPDLFSNPGEGSQDGLLSWVASNSEAGSSGLTSPTEARASELVGAVLDYWSDAMIFRVEADAINALEEALKG